MENMLNQEQGMPETQELPQGLEGVGEFADPFIPKPIKLGAEKEQDLINTVVKNYGLVKNSTWFPSYMEKLKVWHNAYLGMMDPTTFPWDGSSNIDLGIIEMCVDNIKSRYKLSTIGASPMFNAIPVNEEGEEYKTKVTDDMTYILYEDINVEPLLDEITQKATEFGTCVTKLFWKRDIREKKEYDQIEGVMFPKDLSLIEEKGCVEVINLEDFIIPENAPEDIEKCPWVYHRVWYSVYDLEKKVKLKFYSEAKVEEIKAGLISQKMRGDMTAEEAAKQYKMLPEEQVEILECYMRFDADGDGTEEECIFWICPATNTYLKGFYLKDLYHKGKRPFQVYRYKKTGSFYGRGVVEMLLPYRQLMNQVFNYGINCLMLQIMPWGFYRIGSSFKPEEVRLAPGVMIPIDDINDVKMATFPSQAGVLDKIVQFILSFVERQTGISSPHMGKEFPTRKTATEVRTIISEGNVKHEDRIQVFQNVFASQIKGIYNLYRQNQGKDKKGRIMDDVEKYRFIRLFSAFDMMPDMDFIILGTLTTGNKTIEREDVMALYSITAQHPIMAQWPKGQLEMLKEVFQSYGKRNIKRFLPPDELVDAVQGAMTNNLMGSVTGGQPGAPQGEPQGPDIPPAGQGRPM
jgi:hypothetical protein